jgi:hypothetical protein
MNFFPYIYDNAKSIDTYRDSLKYLEENQNVKDKIQTLGIIYNSIRHSVPQTIENFWSGHSFPLSESWDDIQISATLCFFGLYKQAFSTLRSGLELGLLSVYNNINDDGHETVREWFYSLDGTDSNTPRADKNWKILLSNSNIEEYNNKFDLKSDYLSLGYLHNYVHTKGHKYSNSLDGQKGNSQVFIASALLEWLNTYEKIAVIVVTLHLLKYPLGLFKFDYYRKFGINMPNVAQVSFNASFIASLLEKNKLEEIQNIANKDTQTKDLLSQLNAIPDKTDNEIEEQVIEFEKRFIKRYVGGFKKWEDDQLKSMNDMIAAMKERDNTDFKNNTLNRIEVIRKWATENNIA